MSSRRQRSRRSRKRRGSRRRYRASDTTQCDEDKPKGTGGFSCTVGGRKWNANVQLAEDIDPMKREALMRILPASYVRQTLNDIRKTAQEDESVRSIKEKHVKRVIMDLQTLIKILRDVDSEWYDDDNIPDNVKSPSGNPRSSSMYSDFRTPPGRPSSRQGNSTSETDPRPPTPVEMYHPSRRDSLDTSGGSPNGMNAFYQ